ncbi:MAG: hypothetical protein ACRCXB_28570 [Aeromonadaceae bacterium]
MKHIATVPADLIRAAMVMQAKNDVRFYLCGVMIDAESIAATDGHMMICSPYESTTRPEQPIIVSISGKIPSKARDLELLYDDEKEIGIIRCTEPTPLRMKVKNNETGEFEEVPPKSASILDKHGHPQMIFWHKIDGRFPDYKRVIPQGDLVPTSVYGINCDNLARVSVALKALGSKSGAVKASMRGTDSAIILEPNMITYPGVRFIIMPCRI